MELRILMASDFYPPFIGGAERQMQLLGRELARRDHDVCLATVWHAGLPEQEADNGVQVRRLKAATTLVPWFSKDPRRRFHPPFPEPSFVWGLRQIIQRFQPDLVHASGWIAYSCAAALFGRRTPLVISARDYGYSCATRTLLHGGGICEGPTLKKCLGCASRSYGIPKALAAVAGIFSSRPLLARKVAAIHHVSAFMQKIVQRDFSESPVASVVIPSFNENSLKGVLAAEFTDRLPAEPYILFVGALQPNKGLGILLKAYKQLTMPPPLVLIGSIWPDTPKEFLAGVIVLYNVPHPVVMAAWERCLFGVAPSVWPDPLPGVVREAMSKGKAVIGTAVGGIVDMIAGGETGLLVPPGDVDALAEAMRKLIEDPEMRERLGRAGQEDVKRFGADRVVPRFEKLYRELVDEARERHQ